MKGRNWKRVAILSLVTLLTGVALLCAFVWWKEAHRPRFQDKTVREWVTSFSREPSNEVVNAFGTSAVPELMEILEESEDLFRKATGAIWRKLPIDLQKRFERLRPLNFSEAPRMASLWLRKLGPDAEEAVPRFQQLQFTESHLAGTLAIIGEDHPASPEILSDLLEHNTTMVRNEAALAPAVLKERAFPMFEGLTNFIVNHPTGAPFNALLGIGYLGPQASNAVPLLATCLKDTNLFQNSLSALRGIGSGALAALPTLCLMADQLPEKDLVKVVDCIRRMGAQATNAVPTLEKLRSDETNLLQLLIALSLSEIQNDRSIAAAALEKSIRSPEVGRDPTFTISIPDERTTLGALYGLRHRPYALLITGDSADYPELLPLFQEALEDPNFTTRVLAARAIWRHTQEYEKVLPAISEALLSEDQMKVHYALEVLGEVPLKESELGPAKQFYENMKKPWRQRQAVLRIIRAADPEYDRAVLLGSKLTESNRAPMQLYQSE